MAKCPSVSQIVTLSGLVITFTVSVPLTIVESLSLACAAERNATAMAYVIRIRFIFSVVISLYVKIFKFCKRCSAFQIDDGGLWLCTSHEQVVAIEDVAVFVL